MNNWKTNNLKNDDIFLRKGTSFKGGNFQLDFDLAHENAESKSLEIEKTQVTGEFTLKPLKKEPMEEYFSQTTKKKQSMTGQVRMSRNELHADTEEDSQKSKKKESEEEKQEREKYLMRYFELERKMQNDERVSYLQHKRAEKEYVLEQEKLAETWMTFINIRRQSADEKGKRENGKTSNRIGQRSEGRTWTNGARKYKKWTNRKGSFGRNTREKETQNPEISNLDDLGEEICEKLTFVDED